jgi:serine/threonine-protein kinase
VDAQRSFATYTNLVEIGRGGMATVYRATAPNGNLVALKILAIHLAADPTAHVRFQQESNLSLSHPNIVRVLDSGIDGDTPYIVMEYIAGESLDKWIVRAGKLTPQELAPILLDVARALDYAHGRNIIHRDVKPSNILIRANGRAMLADFGIAKAAGATAYTATTARVGSVFYMSPEQANGMIELTPATDIYALGVTAYYALAGRHPFEGDNEIAIARQHLDLLPRHVSDVNPAVPRSAGDVVMQALAKSPLQRPASAGAFARGFVNALTAPAYAAAAPLSPQPGAAQTTPQSKPAPVNSSRFGRWWIGAAALGLIVIGALAAVLLMVLGGDESQQNTSANRTSTSAAAGAASPTGPFIAIVTEPPQVLAPLFTPTWTVAPPQSPTRFSSVVVLPLPSPTSMPAPVARPTRRLTPTWTPAPPFIPPPIIFPTIPTAPFFPTDTPAPTNTPLPTASPTPTQTPVPSDTAMPTAAAPTPTPAPTLTAIIVVQ